MPKKILHIINSMGIGGAEKLLAAVISGLDGYEHHLVVLKEVDSASPVISREHAFLNLGIKNKRSFIRAISKVRRYIKDNRIDIVHSHLYEAIILSRLATPRHIPLFNTIHAISSQAAYDGNRLTLFIEKFTYRRRHHIIAVSQEVLNDFEKHAGLKGPATVLYNFIEERFFAPHPKTGFSSDKLKLVAVGNLRHQKNYPYLLEAFRHLPPQVSLDIYGEGTMQNELQEKINQHNLNIRLCGLEKNLHMILPSYDAFVMSSFFEGQPLSLLEAMASGLPSFLADIPVLREVTGDDAIYFDIKDPQSFGKRVEEVLQGKRDLKTLAANAHRRVNAFAHQDQYFQKLNAIYNGR